MSLQAAVAGALEHVPGFWHQSGLVHVRQGTLHWTRYFRVGRCRDGEVPVEEPHVGEVGVVVALGPDAGVFSSQVHWTMTDTTGTAMSFDGVWTLVYQRLDGRWKVVLGHDSYAVAEAAEET